MVYASPEPPELQAVKNDNRNVAVINAEKILFMKYGFD
jgi:hypothetical protein